VATKIEIAPKMPLIARAKRQPYQINDRKWFCECHPLNLGEISEKLQNESVYVCFGRNRKSLKIINCAGNAFFWGFTLLISI
jgi:hypothetical protein